jgi:uncharacterized protein
MFEKWRLYRNHPAHRAILQDLPLEGVDKSLLKEKDFFGFTAFDLDLLLHKKRFPSHITVPKVYKEGEVCASTPGEYESYFHIKYVPHLYFNAPRTLFKIAKRCRRSYRKSQLYVTQLWTGAYYAKEIRSLKIPNVSVRWINDRMGFGLFSDTPIPKKAFIGEYAGKLRPKRQGGSKYNSYLFEYRIGEKATAFTIDAEAQGNYCRFINHKKKGNVDPVIVYLDGIMRVVLYANRNIAADEEITYDYGDRYWSKRESPEES